MLIEIIDYNIRNAGTDSSSGIPAWLISNNIGDGTQSRFNNINIDSDILDKLFKEGVNFVNSLVAEEQKTQNGLQDTPVLSENNTENTIETTTDGIINLSAIDQMIEQYFTDPDSIIMLNSNENTPLVFNENNRYKFVGENLQIKFLEPGHYKASIIARDDKGETRIEEIEIHIRDYQKLFIQGIIILSILLAIILGLKYILRAKVKRSAALKTKKKKK